MAMNQETSDSGLKEITFVDGLKKWEIWYETYSVYWKSILNLSTPIKLIFTKLISRISLELFIRNTGMYGGVLLKLALWSESVSAISSLIAMFYHAYDKSLANFGARKYHGFLCHTKQLMNWTVSVGPIIGVCQFLLFLFIFCHLQK